MDSKFKDMLSIYKHSRPIIYSHIEGQYGYDLHFDEERGYGILFTRFNKNYVFGQVPNDKMEFFLTIRKHLDNQPHQEIILYSPNQEWDDFLQELTSDMFGNVETRYLYYLNIDKFEKYDTTNSFVKLETTNENGSRIEFPIANTYMRGKRISYAQALMMGDNQAELDVWTDKDFRKKGFGFDGCLILIKHLLENNITPNWSCWEKKNISHTLARKLGFEVDSTYKAYIFNK